MQTGTLQIETTDGTQPVHTRYTVQGQGDPLVLLHGGLESGADWAAIGTELARSRRVWRPDRRGHGRTPDVAGPYTYEAMARETCSFLERAVCVPTDLVGYSDGGVCALLVALHRPHLVRSLVLIGTHCHHDGLLSAMVERLRHPDPRNPRLEPMREAYAALSPDGERHWDEVHRKTSAMALSGPALQPQDLSGIKQPTLVIVGDDDVVDHHHTVDLYEALPNARLAIVPSTSHLLPHEAPDQLLELIGRFLDGQETKRLMPMRKTEAAPT